MSIVRMTVWKCWHLGLWDKYCEWSGCNPRDINKGDSEIEFDSEFKKKVNLCTFEEVKKLSDKIRETRDTIENTYEEYFDVEDLKILAEECSKLSLICNNTIMLIKESEE